MKNLIITVLCIFFVANSVNAQTLIDKINELVKDAPDPGKEGLKKKLPGELVNVKFAYYGVYALMQFQDSKRLGIFNLAQGQFQTMLELKSSNYLMVASADIMIIYYVDIKILEIWDLVKFQTVKAKKIDLESGFITHIEMGALAKNKALISGAQGAENLDRRFYGIINLETFEINIFKEWNLFHNSSYRDSIHLRLNNDMSKALAWATSHTPTGFVSVSLSDKPSAVYIHDSMGSLNFTNNNLAVTGYGEVLNSDGHLIKSYPNSMCFPVLGGDFYMQYILEANNKTGSKLIVRDSNTHSPINEITISKDATVSLSKNEFIKSQMTPDKILLASKFSNRILLIDNKLFNAYTYNLGVNGMTGPGLPPFAYVGKEWTFPLEYPPGTKIKLEDGPDGMVYNNGSLKWASPTGKNIHDILISIIKPGEEEFYKEFKVWVK